MKKLMPVAVGALILVSLGGVGGAYASGKITGAQIKNQTITSADIAAGGVGASEIRNGGVGANDLSQTAKDSLKGQDGKDGVDGKDGTNGTNGTDGKDGVDGKNGVANLTTDGTDPGETVAAGAQKEVVITCQDGQKATGGGYSITDDSGNPITDPVVAAKTRVLGSYPYFTGDYTPSNARGSFVADAWHVNVLNLSDTDVRVRPWIVCADVPSAN